MLKMLKHKTPNFNISREMLKLLKMLMFFGSSWGGYQTPLQKREL